MWSSRVHLVRSATGCDRWLLAAHAQLQRVVRHCRVHAVRFKLVLDGVARWRCAAGGRLRQRWDGALFLEVAFAKHLVLLLGDRVTRCIVADGSAAVAVVVRRAAKFAGVSAQHKTKPMVNC